MKETQYQKMVEQTVNYFEEEFKESEKYKPSISQVKDPQFKGSRSLTHKWDGMDFSQQGKEPEHTGYDKDTLITIAKSSVEVPEGFKPHQRL